MRWRTAYLSTVCASVAFTERYESAQRSCHLTWGPHREGAGATHSVTLRRVTTDLRTTTGDGALAPPPASTPSPMVSDYGDPAHYLNRELSWLEFNARVLHEAGSADVPLFERLKFLGIFFSNLDEFFMVRVAGLQAQTLRTITEVPPDGMLPHEQLVAISQRVHTLMDVAYMLWSSEMIPALRRAGIVIVRPEELAPADLAALDERFRTDIFPVLTPLAIDPGHPFPHLRNKTINLGIMFSHEHEGREPGFGVIQVPAMLSRLMRVRVEGTVRAFVLLEDVIARHVNDFFPSARLRGTYAFRVTRNWDLEIDEEEGEDLLQTIQAELRRRDRGNAVRVEIGMAEGVDASVQRLSKALHIDARARRLPRSRAPPHCRLDGDRCGG